MIPISLHTSDSSDENYRFVVRKRKKKSFQSFNLRKYNYHFIEFKLIFRRMTKTN